MKQTILITFQLLLSLAVGAQTQVTEFNPGLVANGVNYALPKTVLKTDVSAIKVVYSPGEFAKYADRYLHVRGVSQEPSTTWVVQKLEMYQEGIPDTSKVFTVKLKDKTIAPMAQLTPSGILVAVNTHTEMNEHVLPESRTTNHRLDARQYLTEDILSATSTVKMAELTAQQIQELKEQRQLLVTGEADEMPQDESQLRLMINEIDAQCDALTSLFTGTISRDTTEQVLTICPDRELEHDVLFRLSRRLGLVDADDLSGVPFYLTLKKLNDAEGIPAPDNKKHEGFYVNVPTLARMTIEQDGQQLATFDIPFAQFGFVDLRDGGLFKGNNTHLQLHPATGAVVKMTTDAEQ